MGTRSGAGRRRTRAASLAARRIESECDALCVAEGDRADYLSARADEYDWRARAHAIAEEAGDDAGKLELAALAFDAALAARDAARSVCALPPDPMPRMRRIAVRAHGGQRDYRDDRTLALYAVRSSVPAADLRVDPWPEARFPIRARSTDADPAELARAGMEHRETVLVPRYVGAGELRAVRVLRNRTHK